TYDGYLALAEQALSARRAAGLPPLAHLALLRAQAHKPGQAEAFLDSACSAAEQLLEQMGGPEVELLGPVPAPMERRAGKHRAQLLLQCMSRAPLHRLLTPWLQSLEQLPGGRQVRWSLDIDPIDLF
ncbi:primosomal protein N', partial [Pseudomonas aeruginosa]